MATEVIIPAMGESISSGILATWHIKDGDYVEKEQVLFELETDKITSEANAEVSGIISIKVPAEEEVDIGQVVALIDESVNIAPGGKVSVEVDTPTIDSRSIKIDSDPEPVSTSKNQVAEDAGINYSQTLSPAARVAAEETDVDLSAINGSGKDGRITKGDILDKAANKSSAEKTEQVKTVSIDDETLSTISVSERQETRKKMSPLRKKIAERLVAATQEAAMLTTFNEVDMSAVIKLRKQHQDKFIERHHIKLGFMSFFTKAVTHALQAVPQVNSRIESDEVVTQHYFDIGIAVGTEKGLMVPVLRNCDQKGFAEIENDILSYAKSAREGKIQMGDLQGGVFTISNGGIYGSMLSTPIMNHPQPAILGLHNITERAVVIKGEIVARPMMYLALSYDHRLIDGKEAVTFLVKVKEAIEDPAKLMFGI